MTTNPQAHFFLKTVDNKEFTITSICLSQSTTENAQSYQSILRSRWHRFHKHSNSVLSADDTIHEHVNQSFTAEDIIISVSPLQMKTKNPQPDQSREPTAILMHISVTACTLAHHHLPTAACMDRKTGCTWNGTGSPSHILVHCHSNWSSLSKSKAQLAWPYIISIILILSAPTSCFFFSWGGGGGGGANVRGQLPLIHLLACLVHFEQRTRNPAFPTPPKQQQQQPAFDTLCCVLIVFANIKPCCYICCRSRNDADIQSKSFHSRHAGDLSLQS